MAACKASLVRFDLIRLKLGLLLWLRCTKACKSIQCPDKDICSECVFLPLMKVCACEVVVFVPQRNTNVLTLRPKEMRSHN